MIDSKRSTVAAVFAVLAVLAGCGDAGNDGHAAPDVRPVTADTKAGGGKSPATPVRPSPPISFRYDVQGTPIVGQPVAVNVFVSSPAKSGPMSLSYRVTDASSMTFPKSQALRSQMAVAENDEPRRQQITVIPQREGRLYLNVSAEIETPDGTMMRTVAIPIQVGSAPPDLEVNGELVETEDGEVVVSMPAE